VACKKIWNKSLVWIKNNLEDNGNLHHFAQLVEKQGSKVAQTEQTILIDDKEVIVTSE